MSAGGGRAGERILIGGLAVLLGACDLEPPRDVSPVTPFVRPDPTSATSPRPGAAPERPSAPAPAPAPVPAPGAASQAPTTPTSPPGPTAEELLGPDDVPALLRLLGDRRQGRDADARLARLFRGLARRGAEPPDRKLAAAAAKLMAAGKARGGPLAAAPATLLVLGLHAELEPELKLAEALYVQGRAATARLGGATGAASKPGPELREELPQLDLALRHQLASLAWRRGRKADARKLAAGFARVADETGDATSRLEELGVGWPGFRFLEAELAEVPFSLEASPPKAFVPGKPVDVKIVLKNLGTKAQTVQVVRSPQGGLLLAEGLDVQLVGEPASPRSGGKREPYQLKPGASLAGTLRLKGPKARKRVLLSASWSWSPPSTSKLSSSVSLRSIAELSPR